LQARWAECTPSYFNQEGRVDQRVMRNGSFGGSIFELRDTMATWREQGTPGLTKRKA
jgi:cyclohexanone monooxygenase